MNTEELHLLLARSDEGPLSDEEQAILRQALADSSELRALQSDLIKLRHLASKAAPAPSQELAQTLLNRVEHRYGDSAPNAREGLLTQLKRWFTAPPAIIAMAAMVLALIALSLAPWRAQPTFESTGL